jgi:aminopeptidase N
MKNYLSNGTSDWVNVETFISTSEDQIAIAPGSLVSEKVEHGRRMYHYAVDTPSQNFYSFISARYEVKRSKWKDIDIEVYYHPAHEVNVERMSRAVERSLAYYTANFGPYFHKQARIIEFPRYATFAQAFPGTMPYSEAIGFIINIEDESKNNIVDAVIAHEMAHQYWAHQVIGAHMQGATMLSESFAEYSALMVMKQETPLLEMKEFIKHDLQRYLRGRSREEDEEQALTKVEDQGHIHYGKGSVILYALQDYIGEDSVNAALKDFLEEYRYQEPPYPTTHDFMEHLEPRVPDSMQYLIGDWFEEITLYDLRVTEAIQTKNSSGGYDVTVGIKALKNKAQPNGEVQDIRINDWVDIGFFSDSDEEHLIYKERVFMNDENLSFDFTLDSLPLRAAVDPLRLLIDRVYDDNRKTVELRE